MKHYIILIFPHLPKIIDRNVCELLCSPNTQGLLHMRFNDCMEYDYVLRDTATNCGRTWALRRAMSICH